MTTDRFRKEGFTLIELLVVIGILALLAALIFPIFASAGEKGRATVCVSNLHQLHTAFAMYAEDDNGLLPKYYARSVPDKVVIYFYVNENGKTYKWPDQSKELVDTLHPYTHSDEIWFCPSDPHADATWYHTSYIYDGVGLGTGNTNRAIDYRASYFSLLEDDTLGSNQSPNYTHNDRYNVLYRDGHIESRSICDFSIYSASSFCN